MELKQKGTTAAIGAFGQLRVSLIWTSAVDLDLMVLLSNQGRPNRRSVFRQLCRGESG